MSFALAQALIGCRSERGWGPLLWCRGPFAGGNAQPCEGQAALVCPWAQPVCLPLGGPSSTQPRVPLGTGTHPPVTPPAVLTVSRTRVSAPVSFPVPFPSS